MADEKVTLELDVEDSGANQAFKDFKGNLKTTESTTASVTSKIKTNFKKTTSSIKQGFGDASTAQYLFMSGNTQLASALSKAQLVVKAFGVALNTSLGIIGLVTIAIGAVVGALSKFFTGTKRGQEMFSRAMSIVNSVIDVVMDRVALLGEAVVKIFKGDWSGAMETAKQATTGLVDEIKEESAAALTLEKRVQALADAERKLSVEKEKQRAEIAKLKFEAEDASRSLEDRATAAKKAFEMENSLVAESLRLAKESADIQRERNELGESTAEDLDALAEKEKALFAIQRESTEKQIELNNKLNTIKQQQGVINAANQVAELERLKELEGRLDVVVLKSKESVADVGKSISSTLIEVEQVVGGVTATMAEEISLMFNRLQIKNQEFAAKNIEVVGAIQGSLSNLKGVFEKNEKMQKRIAIAEALVNTYVGVTKALGSAPPPFNFILAGTTFAAGMKAVANIRKQGSGGGGGGGGGLSSPSISPTSIRPPSIQITPVPVTDSGNNTIKAIVVESDITTTQNKVSSVQEKASFG